MTEREAAGTGDRLTWRHVGGVLLAVLVVSGVGEAVSWWQVADLRDLDGIQRVEAEVTGQDFRRYRADLVEVRFQSPGPSTRPYPPTRTSAPATGSRSPMSLTILAG